MAKREELEFRASFVDDASKGVDGVAEKLDEIDGRTVEATVTVDDRASAKLEDVESKAEAVDKIDPEVELTAEDRATAEIEDVRRRAVSLSATEYQAELTAKISQLEREVGKANRLLLQVDGEKAEAVLEAKNLAQAKLDAYQRELDDINGRIAEATVDADIGQGLVSAEGDLDDIDGRRVEATVDADRGSGLDEILDDIGGIPTSLGNVGTITGRLASPGGAIALLGGGLLAAAGHAAAIADEVGSFASLMGSSTEEASRFLAVMDRVGLDFNDVLEIAAEVSSKLRENPELARQLGISLDTLRERPLQALIEAIDGVAASEISAGEKLELLVKVFGEEGSKQLGRLLGLLGPDGLRGEMDEISDSRLISDEDVAEARRLKEQIAEFKGQFQGVALEVGQKVIPAIEGIGLALDALPTPDLFPGDVPLSDFIEGGAGAVDTLIAKLAETEEVATALEAAIRANKITTAEWNEVTADGVVTTEELNRVTEETPGFLETARDLTEQYTDATEESTDATEDNTRSNEENIRRLEQRRRALEDSIAAADRAARADRDLADGFLDSREAARRAEESVEDYNAIKAEGRQESETAAQFERRLDAALDGVVRAADAVAAATVDKTRKSREARGMTLNEVEATRLHSLALLNNARTLNGPERTAVLEHIARINNIPAAKLTEILTDADPNDLAQVEAEINNAARNRFATIEVDTVFRHPVIRAHIDSTGTSVSVGRIVASAFAKGTPSAPRGLAIVGEEGPELIELEGGEKIHPANRTVQLLEQMAATVGGGGTTNIVNHFPAGIRPADVASTLRRYLRRNGPDSVFGNG